MNLRTSACVRVRAARVAACDAEKHNARKLALRAGFLGARMWLPLAASMLHV